MSQSSQVFLSFRGPDTRFSFTDYLYERLKESRYRVFRDKEGIACGQTIRSTLQTAIQESKISIVVLSKEYSSSKWCLDELVMIMNRHQQEGHHVLPVFYYVDPSDVRHERGEFAEAFAEHEESFKGEMDRVEGWRAALGKVGELKGEHVKEGRYQTEVIQTIVEDVGRIMGSGVEQRKYALPAPELVGQGFERARQNILSLLMKDEVARIGVFGIGGVGKTTLVKHIHNQLLKESENFHNVYWITASQDCDIHRLQSRIACAINFEISNKEDETSRAAKLVNELAEKGSFVLIIDDLWKYFDLEDVALPPRQNRYKLIFTTRSLEVCRQMDCQENTVKVEPLSLEEAWVLFKRELGAYDIKEEPLAKEIVEECAGLPLAIKTIGRSMRGVDDPREWRNALDELKDPKVGNSHMEPVFQILRFSYIRLNNSSLQQCLLYCALFPEDFQISRDGLIEYLIIEGIIERKKCRREEVDKGQVMISKLVNLCLLEDHDYHHMKMHDLIRDMALKILSEEKPVMVEAGKQLRECPDVDDWKQSLVRVSLISNYICEINSAHPPICPSLSTLLLSRNRTLERITDSFFERFDGLKVLDLSETGIESLSGSVSNLVSLSALLLRYCRRLRHIPSLAKLIALETLDIRGCAIKQVPDGMQFLHKLRYLVLEKCNNLKKFPTGILQNLSRLQVLIFDENLPLKGQGVACLKKLEHLVCRFPNLVEFNNYLRSAKLPNKFQIQVSSYPAIRVRWNADKLLEFVDCDLRSGGDFHKLPEGIEALEIVSCELDAGSLSDSCCLNDASKLKSISIFTCHNEVECLASVSGLLANIFSKLERIYVYNSDNLRGLISNENESGGPLAMPSCTETFARLKSIEISKCHNIKKLFPRGLWRKLQELETIDVRNCDGVEEIIAGEESSTDCSSHFVSLPKLWKIKLHNLPRLETISMEKLICESLASVELGGCPMLKRIPISLPLPFMSVIEVCDCSGMEEIIAGEESSTDCSSHFVSLPKLRVIKLNNLPRFETISREKLICESLHSIELERCPMLKRIPISLPLPSLSEIRISECHNIKQLFPRGLWPKLQKLWTIDVRNCDGVEEIIAGEESSTDCSSHFVSLPKLWEIKLHNLPRLETISRDKLICKSLFSIELVECPMLKRIPISLPLRSMFEIKVGPRDWWEQVEWEGTDDNANAKQIFQPFIRMF